VIQPAGDNEKSHYALVRAIASGRPTVDEVRTNPHLRTIDVTFHRGHWYAAKSPGLALVSVPPYLALKEAGVQTAGGPRRMIWALHLWSVVLPALILLLLVARVADAFEPGAGLPTAVTLGATTLVLPFGTLFFSHVLAAMFAFAAFTLLWSERRGSPRLPFLAAAGVLCGFGVSTESSLLLASLVLGGAYACTRTPWLRRAFAFGAGLAVGVLPLLLFNWWALKSPFRSTYAGWHYPGSHAKVIAFDFGVPTPRSLLVVLLYPTGLPLLAAAVVGVVLLHRRRPLEAWVVLGIAVAFVVANAMTPEVLGGASPGPRYLIPAFPFVALGLPAALRRFPGETAGLAAAGAVMLASATITGPLGALDQHVIQRLRSHSFVGSALELVGIVSGYGVLVFLAATAAALIIAAAALRPSLFTRRELLRGTVTAAAFAVLATQLPGRLQTPGSRALLVSAAIAVGCVAAVVAAHRIPPLGRRPRTVGSESAR
jgi:hypothetical protein